MPHSLFAQDQIVWQMPIRSIIPCRQDMVVDIVIVGGGIVGLSVAYELAKRGIKAVLIEQSYCGSGATGKSSGFVTSNAELSFSDLLKRYPADIAYTLWNLFDQGLESIRTVIKEHNFVCDYQEQETLILARSLADMLKLEKEYKALKTNHDQAAFYTQERLKDLVSSKNYYGALGYKNSFGIDAYAYCQELKKIVQQQGIQVFEETPALSIDGHTIITPYAKITAKKIIMCVDRFLPRLSLLKQQVYHVQTFLMASSQLTDKQIQELFPKKKYMCWDTDLIYTYFRITGDKRLLLGGGTPFSTYASKEYHDYKPIIQKLNSYFKFHFPQTDIQFEYSWPGLIGISKDIFPLAGVDQERPYIHYISGAAGLSVGAGLARYTVEHLFDDRVDLDEYLSPYRSFPIGGLLQSCIGDKASFALSHLFYKNIP